MSLTKRVSLLAGAGALTLACGGWADTSQDATNEELKARVAELESRLAAVEANDGERWLTEARADEIKGLVQDVLADADTRASLLAQGMQAGYEDGFVLSSDDGNWLLRTNFLMQNRFIIGTQDNTGGDDDQWAFENTRSKFTLSGNVVDQNWYYKVSINVGTGNGGGFDPRTGTLDAYMGYDFGNGVKVWGGSYKAPILREDIIDAQYQQAVERSVVNYFYTGGYMDGIGISYEGEAFRALGSYNDGLASGQTSFATPINEFAFTARGEYRFSGAWEQFDDLTSSPDDEMGVMVGGAVHYQTSDTDAGLPDVDVVLLTFDGQVEFGGGNVYGAFIYQNVDVPGIDADQIAIVIGGGYYFADTWEVFGRYEWSDLDAGAGVDDISILTLGVNKYFEGHGAKWTTDIGIGFDSLAAGVPITGYRADAVGEDGQVVIRTQLQIAF